MAVCANLAELIMVLLVVDTDFSSAFLFPTLLALAP